MLKIWVSFLILVLVLGVKAQNISNIRLKTIENKNISLKEVHQNGPVVLAFWATWCKPCRKELPALKPIYDKFKDKGLTIVAISIDSPRSINQVKSFVKSGDLPYLFLIDADGQESSKLLVKDIPYTILANEDGDIVYTHRGYKEGDELDLEKKILELIPEE